MHGRHRVTAIYYGLRCVLVKEEYGYPFPRDLVLTRECEEHRMTKCSRV